MSKSARKYPYADTEIVCLLQERIAALEPVKSQRQIAAEVGYDRPNALSMYKRGEAATPLKRLPNLARALELDLSRLFRAWLAQRWPGEDHAIAQMVEQFVVTAPERSAIRLLRTYLRVGSAQAREELLEHLRQHFQE